MADQQPAWEEWAPATLLPFGLDAAGRIQLSAAAMDMLGQPEAVILFYDRGAGIIGLRKATGGEPNSYRVHANGKNRGSRGFQVTDFLGHYGIDYSAAKRFPGHDYGDGICGFVLAEGQPSSRGGRRPRVSVPGQSDTRDAHG
jgi:hypothetical protein